jgi:hypothetical protein
VFPVARPLPSALSAWPIPGIVVFSGSGFSSNIKSFLIASDADCVPFVAGQPVLEHHLDTVANELRKIEPPDQIAGVARCPFQSFADLRRRRGPVSQAAENLTQPSRGSGMRDVDGQVHEGAFGLLINPDGRIRDAHGLRAPL